MEIQMDGFERFVQLDDDEMPIYDREHDCVVLEQLSDCYSEQYHIADQLGDIAIAILNGKAPKSDGAVVDRYQVFEYVPADGEGDMKRFLCVRDTTPPISEDGFEAPGYLFRGPLPTEHDDQEAVIEAALRVANGLNQIAYDWKACTREMFDRRERAPTPDWA